MARRDVGPFLRFIRELFLGRVWNKQYRFQADMSPRPGPQPVLPESSYVTISDNLYYKRDVRRELAPPVVIPTSGGVKQIPAKGSEETSSETSVKRAGPPLPGRQFEWIKADDVNNN